MAMMEIRIIGANFISYFTLCICLDIRSNIGYFFRSTSKSFYIFQIVFVYRYLIASIFLGHYLGPDFADSILWKMYSDPCFLLNCKDYLWGSLRP